ncbi:iron-containing alcohol dehydrogenase [Caldinitratiruptor microaerophilus]|uniref:Alcohol dehydrogenase n=1 Tax=Caldinitratiruptor microaerophilus TaxID=671077 RepID=A0AA35CHN1_9FIRM|nr:iron-containing alcohol dehydrogenase [Caldinitratiruptor microaerophilus]BDG59062.1 alcohol dehydrogenase [Caldinitratiruptor microaerophilus]
MVFPFRMPGVLYAGVGALDKLGPEVQRLGGDHVVVVTDKGLVKAGVVDSVLARLKEIGVAVTVFDEVEAEPSTENCEKAASAVVAAGARLIVAVGGGSSLDVAKGSSILAAHGGKIADYFGIDKVPGPGLPWIGIPTTSGTGSEVTPNAIFTDKMQQLKIGVVSPYLLPTVAIVDPVLTLTVPPAVTAATGIDALTHAIESFTAPKATPQTDLYALEAIRLISRSLRKAVWAGKDLQARTDMAYGSLFAGVSLGNAGVGAVHALGYPLGGQFGVTHGVSMSLLLPYVMEFNMVADIEKFARVAEAMGENVAGLSTRAAAARAVEAVRTLSVDVGIPQRLRDVGIPESALDGLAEAAMKVTRLLDNNPRKVTLEDARALYQAAY